MRSSTQNGATISAADAAVVVAEIFSQEIKVEKVGIDDSFFDLGGDSLTAENIVLAVRKRFDVDLQTAVLLEAGTPRELAEMVLRTEQAQLARKLVVQMSVGAGGEPLAMIHGMSGSPLFANRFGAAVREKYRLVAVRGMGLELGEALHNDIGDITQAYFDGLVAATGRRPRFVGGICLGGLIAVEVGRLVHSSTGRRPSLVLIDPPPRGSAWLRPEKDNRMTERRQRQMDREVTFWQWMRDATAGIGMGQSLLGKKARREAFKKNLTRAVAGFSPEPFPCDVLVLASSEWGVQTVHDYQSWATDQMNVQIKVMPGRHQEFRDSNADAIDQEILAFLAKAQQ